MLSSVMNDPSFPSTGADCGPYSLAAGETSVQLMPESNFRLSIAPAKVDFPIVHPAWKVDQAGKIILELYAKLPELLLQFIQALLVAFEFRQGLLEFLLVRIQRRALVLRLEP